MSMVMLDKIDSIDYINKKCVGIVIYFRIIESLFLKQINLLKRKKKDYCIYWQ
jgi:hypothetical protein